MDNLMKIYFLLEIAKQTTNWPEFTPLGAKVRKEALALAESVDWVHDQPKADPKPVEPAVEPKAEPDEQSELPLERKL